MVVKRGRFGQFLACTGYPECKTTRKLIATKQGGSGRRSDQILDEDARVRIPLVVKRDAGEFTAYKYPGQPSAPDDRRRPKDGDKGGGVVERKSKRGKAFWLFDYPMRFRALNRPIVERCPSVRAVPGRNHEETGGKSLQNEGVTTTRSEELVETSGNA
jgi:DNA topoisomerase-1